MHEHEIRLVDAVVKPARQHTVLGEQRLKRDEAAPSRNVGCAEPHVQAESLGRGLGRNPDELVVREPHERRVRGSAAAQVFLDGRRVARSSPRAAPKSVNDVARADQAPSAAKLSATSP